jgi:hypothetical protein
MMNGVIGLWQLGLLGFGLWQRGFLDTASASMSIGGFLLVGGYGLWRHMPLARGAVLVVGAFSIGLSVFMALVLPAKVWMIPASFFVYGLVQIGVLTRPSVRALFDKTTSAVPRSGGD